MIHEERTGVGAGGEFRFIAVGNGLVGWVRNDLPQELLVDLVRDPKIFFSAPASEILKNVRKATVIRRVVNDREGVARRVIIKRFHPGSLLRRAGSLIVPSRAARCLRAALLLKKAGIETASPLVALESRKWKGLGASYYMSEELTSVQSLRALLKHILSAFPQTEGRLLKFRLLRGVARLFYQLHASGIYHRDLKGSNILVCGWESPRWELLLVDLDGVSRMGYLWRSRRIKNLVQLCRIRSWSVRDKIYFLKNYSDLFPLEKAGRKRLWRKVLALSDKRKAGEPDSGQATRPR